MYVCESEEGIKSSEMTGCFQLPTLNLQPERCSSAGLAPGNPPVVLCKKEVLLPPSIQSLP